MRGELALPDEPAVTQTVKLRALRVFSILREIRLRLTSSKSARKTTLLKQINATTNEGNKQSIES